jgi:hypothetical protein
MELFGFNITRNTPAEEPISFAPPENDEGAMMVSAGGVYGTYVDLDGSIRTEAELVNKYREMASHPDIELALEDIINEAIINDPQKEIVNLNMDDLEQPDRIKEMIRDEFKNVQKLLEFNKLSYELFRRWYVDGRMYYHLIIDEKNPGLGITELRYVDPRKIRKIKQINKKKTKNGVPLQQLTSEYYVYNDKGFGKAIGTSGIISDSSVTGIKIAKDSIVHVTSGLQNVNGDLVLSYLHKAMKPLNQLKSLEDSLVIYRLSRAPERRIFYIDVGNLPKMKAEQYLRDIMTRFKNKVVYDSATGEIRDDRKFMTMLEDFWLPRREGGKGTEITTLPGGQNLGQIDDVVYFQRKLYKALNVPITRLDQESQYSFGRATEISRDEVKFAKFIQRLRARFSELFNKVLEKQLILKGIITLDDWPKFREYIRYEYSEDNHFAELRNTEILRDRIAMLRDVDDYAGKYYSHEWIRKHVLYQNDDEIKQIDDQIIEERDNEQYNPAAEDGQQPPAGAAQS